MIIDKTDKKYEHIPDVLNGLVLLEESADGFITIPSDEFKYIAENSTISDLKRMGYEKHLDKIERIKGPEFAQIVSKNPQ